MPLTITFEAVLKPKNVAESLFDWINNPASAPDKSIKDFPVSIETMKKARSAAKKAGFSIIAFSNNGNYLVCHGTTKVFENLFGVVIYDYQDSISTIKDKLQDRIDIRTTVINPDNAELVNLIKDSIDGILLQKPERILEDPIKIINQNAPPPISAQHNPNNFFTRTSDEPVPLELIDKLRGSKDILVNMGLGKGIKIGVIDTGWLGGKHPYNETIKKYFGIEVDLNVKLVKFQKDLIVFKTHMDNFDTQFIDAKAKFASKDYEAVKSFLLKFFPWDDTKSIELQTLDTKKQETESEAQSQIRIMNALEPYFNTAQNLIKTEKSKIESFMYSRDDESPYHGTKVVFQILPFAPLAEITVYKSFETLNNATSIDYLIGGAIEFGKNQLVSNSWGPFYEKKIDTAGGGVQEEVVIQGKTADQVRNTHFAEYQEYFKRINKNKDKCLVFHAAANGRLKTIFQENPGEIIAVGGASRKTDVVDKVFASTGSSGYTYSPSFFSWNKETTPLVCGWYEKLWVPCLKYDNTGLGEEKQTIVQWILTEGNSLACPQIVGITASVLSFLEAQKTPRSFDVIKDIIKKSVDPVTDGNFAQAEPERTAEKNTGIINIFKVHVACNQLIGKNKRALKDTSKSSSLFW